jgi:WD40 repeat protein/biotin carboxyl carrier protein
MVRWLVASVSLAVAVFLAVAFMSPGFSDGRAPRPSGSNNREYPGPEPVNNPGEAGLPAPPLPSPGGEKDKLFDVKIYETDRSDVASQPLVVDDARLLPAVAVNVPSERDGKIICLATTIRPGEKVADDKIVWVDLGFLAVEVDDREWNTLPVEEQVTFSDTTRKFRRARDTELFLPEHTVLARQKVRLRKLEVGDRVKAGQLLAVINPVIALDELAVKLTKLDSSEADRRSSRAYKEEATRKHAGMLQSNAMVKGSVSRDDLAAAKLAIDKYTEEERSKSSAVQQAQKEVNAAYTTLKMHEIRSMINGVVKVVYKRQGEAVKNLDQVLEIQAPDLIRVEGNVDVSDSQELRHRIIQARDGWEKANAAYEEAQRAGHTTELEIHKKAMEDAIKLTEVIVEPSRPEPPRAILKGHLQEVTCVAVGGGTIPRIVSGSEDGTVRVWEQVPGQARWHERFRLDHHAVVRTLAISPDGKTLATGTVGGRLRFFNLTTLTARSEARVLDGKHAGTVTCLAFSPDGKTLASGGDDRAICLWDVANGKQLQRVGGAHKAVVTSLQYMAPDRLVSAGDKRLIVWKLESGKTPTVYDEFDHRSGEVGQLGVNPEGKQVLFDDGREIRVLSLEKRKIEGTLQNPLGAAGFSNFALFSPDKESKTILTNGSAPGRLQLWRAPSTGSLRASEVRQFVWTTDVITCGAFSPDSRFAVTGTRDHQVLVWEMPSKTELQSTLTAQLFYVEEFLDSSLKRVPIRAEMKKPDWVVPGGSAIIVVPQRPLR